MELKSKDPITQSLNICADCKKQTEMMPDSYDGESKIVCESCDSYYEWCEACQTHNCTEGGGNPCRHLFWNDGDWAGFGRWPGDWEHGKEPFWAMLRMSGIDFAIKLRRSLLAHKYYFQFQGSMFEVHSIFAQLLEEDGKMSWEPNGSLNAVFDEEEEEGQKLVATGINWLMSLWSGCDHDNWSDTETEQADLVAAGWCDEFITVLEMS